MADIDPELRDKIIETHTIVGRMDEELKEHKRVMNARLRDSKLEFDKHKDNMEKTLKEHRAHIDEGKAFRTKVVTYATIMAGVIAFFSEPVFNLIKKAFGA